MNVNFPPHPTQPVSTDVAAAKHPRVYARHMNVNFPPRPTQPVSTDVAAAKHPRVYARRMNVNIPPHPTQPLTIDVAAAKHPRMYARRTNVNIPPHPTRPPYWKSSTTTRAVFHPLAKTWLKVSSKMIPKMPPYKIKHLLGDDSRYPSIFHKKMLCAKR